MTTVENRYKKSFAHYQEAKKFLPNQTQTLSKGPGQFVIGQMPLFNQKAKGCYVWDVDGNKYIDFIGGRWPIILGYANPITDNAVKAQLKRGITFPQSHPLELEVAKLLTEVIPSAEMARFAKNGSDATGGAVRIARAYTKREIILQCGYHGAQDWYIITTERNAGVPKVLKKLIYTFEYNSIGSLEKLFKRFKNKAAAVIMEPMYDKFPKNNFLKKVKELTHKNGALLIFDEIITGFRWSLGGAQKYFGVTPDLACFGKAMANGMPISCVVGKKEIMQKTEDVFLSMTYGGECLSLAAAKATITAMKNNPGILKHIWRMGAILQKGIRGLITKHGLNDFAECVGVPPTPVMHFKSARGQNVLAVKALFQKYLMDQGIMYAAYWNITYSHKFPHINFALRAADRAFAELKEDIAKNRVSQKMKNYPQPVFKNV
ncbi:MAG: aminotransferase class III-fold pyridoxal phosphate-dependent enzyme [Candidatus Giovannonibacteria bacterium]|nr:aminotransferase class III-fold pyridoxal phosphate-dependent enzyme [Candidatus Giovannonibacteria bacterium]